MDTPLPPVAVATPGSTSPLTFDHWLAALSADGWMVLAGHRMPVQLWLARGDDVLHFVARGTRFTLRRYERADLTRLILRSACDCEEHRTAGAGHRLVLAPHAVPLAEVDYDGAARHGWTAVEAGLAPVPLAAAVLEELRSELSGRRAEGSGPVEGPGAAGGERTSVA